MIDLLKVLFRILTQFCYKKNLQFCVYFQNIKNLMLVLVGVTVGMIYYTSIELNSAVASAAGSSTSSMMKH